MKTHRPSDLAEHVLVLRAQLKERDALHELFQRYNEKLLYFLQGKVSSDAEDVLQEVWITVIRKIAALKDPGAFKSWIYRIAYNHAMTRLRRKGAAMATEQLEDHADALQSPNTEPDLEPFRAYEDTVLTRALEGLSPSHREVLTLRFIEELSYDDVATVLGCSIGTVRSRLHYAKRSLRGQLTATTAVTATAETTSASPAKE